MVEQAWTNSITSRPIFRACSFTSASNETQKMGWVRKTKVRARLSRKEKTGNIALRSLLPK